MSSSSTEILVDVTMPQMGVSVAEGTVVGWRVSVGDRIQADQPICEISSDKIDTEVPSPASGVVSEIVVPVETTVAVGEVLARIATGDAHTTGDKAPASPAPVVAAPSAPLPGHSDGNGGPPRRYSPVVQRIAAEHGIDLSTIDGTGRGGRVRKQDVMALVSTEAPLHIESPYRPEPMAPQAPPPPAPAPPAPLNTLSHMRRQIGEHMKRSLDTAATCTSWIEVDMTRAEAARAKLGVTALAFVARAAVEALREHPALNAWLEGDRYTRHPGVNLGIAVSLGDDGLIVPVIRDAHELSVEGLAARVRDLARRARARELTADDVRDGTFTITNPGQYGTIMATPIINQPQVGILDLEAVVKRPVVVEGDAIAVRSMTILGLSWDHRALDGAQAAQFLASVKRRLENVL